jgi:hypothetical protein
MSGRWFGEGKVLQRMSLVGACGSLSHAVSTVLRPRLRQCIVLSRSFFCFCVFGSYVCVGSSVLFCLGLSSVSVCLGRMFVSDIWSSVSVCLGRMFVSDIWSSFCCVFVSCVCVGYLVFFFCMFVLGIWSSFSVCLCWGFVKKGVAK